MPKKILYIANVRLPTEKAHGVQIMEMCHAFAAVGQDVELVVPRRGNKILEEPFSFYDLPKDFLITRLFTWDLVQFGPIGFLIQSLTFTFVAFFYTWNQHAFFYSREDLFLFLLSFTKQPYVYEVHAPRWHFVTRRAIAHAVFVVPISHGLKDFYIQRGVEEARLFVAPDGVNLGRFTITESKEESRKRLGLPADKKIALYSGHLYERKGAHTFAEAAKLLGNGILCVFVGGTDDDITEFKKMYGTVQNIRILGHRPHQDIPYYLKAADVLILPNSAKDADSRLYTSPMKLFEYMASGTPIAASNVPSLREVLNEQNANLVRPDDPHSLSESLSGLLAGSKEVEDRCAHAKKDAQMLSWDMRVDQILQQILRVAQ